MLHSVGRHVSRRLTFLAVLAVLADVLKNYFCSPW
nr:MAG TPA: hypothetical protein [Caudoviricetes sp.]DAM66035.1 MAG TPA: hypothetical protein [Caudoviricetes sp.]